MYLIVNGKLVFEDRIAEGYELLLKDGRIEKIAPAGVIKRGGAAVIDACGGYVSAGFIDIHSDYIEHMAAPRPTSILDFKMAIREIEKQLINQGVTTMFHSLSLMKDSLFTPQKIRTAENVKKMIENIDAVNKTNKLINHRFHARFEVDNLDYVHELIYYLKQRKVHLLSFMDHTPGQGQYRDLEKYLEILQGYMDISDADLQEHIQECRKKEKVDLSTLMHIAEIARLNQITVASHDDDSEQKLDLIKQIGATISEFPVSLEVAWAAKKRGLYTMAGAPNVLLGGSHAGNLSAVEGIMKGCIDILCSDYYPASLLHAVFTMHKKYGLNLVDMMKLVTLNPAKAVGISDEYGSLTERKVGDVIVIETTDDDFPVITTVFVEGRLISTLHYSAKGA
jgi:alpha-D-ribose 1-methylphosphonate 5-triphosphate diphosphatase